MNMDVLSRHQATSNSRHRVGRASVGVCSFQSTSRPAASTLPPKWKSHDKSNKDKSTSASQTLRSLVQSTSFMKDKARTPLTDQILEVGRGMDNPKAQDLAFLLEDAKILHKKLMALDMEDMDLEKFGLFSNEALASFQTPPKPQLKKKPSPVAYEKLLLRQKKMLKSQQSNLPAVLTPTSPMQRASSVTQHSTSFPRASASSLTPNSANPLKSKSLKRNIFSAALGHLKGQKRVNGSLSKSMNEPRHNSAAFFSNRSHEQSPDQSMAMKSRSLNHLNRRSSLASVVMASISQTSPKKNLNRSSSLDFLSCRLDVSRRVINSSQTSPTSATTSPQSSMANSLTDSEIRDLQSNETSLEKSPSPPNPSMLLRERKSIGGAGPFFFTQDGLGDSRCVSVPPPPPHSSSSFSLRLFRARALKRHFTSSTKKLDSDKDAIQTDVCSLSLGDYANCKVPSQQQKKWLKLRRKSSQSNRTTKSMDNSTSHSSPSASPSTHIKGLHPSVSSDGRASSGLDTRTSRPSVGTLVDELTEIEKQVGGSSDNDEPSTIAPLRVHHQDSGIKRSHITASSATLELDQLMHNLEDFEPPTLHSSKNTGSKKPPSAMDDLSNMLGSLELDMENIHGVSTVAKGMCSACKKPILGKVLDALGRQWHPEHFVCTNCEAELWAVTYYESNGRPYCEKDYHELFAPRCAYCNGPILDRVMRALDQTWHPEHFFCTLCGKNFGSEGFHEKDKKAFCRECYYEKYAPRCHRCSKAIMEGFITALNAQWHPECFSCKVCGITFPKGNYFEHEGEPHCEQHYHASRGTLCASCQKPVTGKCVTAMGRKWHPEHFTCAFCLKLLNKGTFKEHRHNPYCQTCYIKLFG